MADEKIEFLSAVLLVSKHAWRLADFYRDVLGIPLQEEQHGDTATHYGCNLGDVHFAIHPVENFPDSVWGTGSVQLAFTVFDLQAMVKRLRQQKINLLYAPVDRGYAISTAIADLDGNRIELTQLKDEWYQGLEDRRKSGIDVIQRWQKSKAPSK